MKSLYSVLILAVGLTSLAIGQNQPDLRAVEAEFDQVWSEIQAIKAADQDVSEELYARYFELEQILRPETAERIPNNHLDQAHDICPGIVVNQPAQGDYGDSLFVDNGTTVGYINDCHHPSQVPPGSCGRGRDVFFKLEVSYTDSVEIFTCDSQFDTYLCLFRDNCCGTLGDRVAFNDDSPFCGDRSLKSYITACLDSGTYYICLDGAGINAQGTYRLEIRFWNGCEPIIPPSCPYEELSEPEIVEGVCNYGTEMSCNSGWCATIDGPGDVDVYPFTIEGCQIVNLSVWADDSPGRTGFGNGLDSYLRLFTTVCEAPISINDDFNGSEGAPEGTDSRISKLLTSGTYWVEVTGKASDGPYEIYLECSSCDN